MQPWVTKKKKSLTK